MPGKITLVRKDGTTIDATPEQAGRLKLLGYQEQTEGQHQVRLEAAAKEDYYTSPEQKVITAGEGGLAGLTFGASDYLFGDEGTQARAQFNPGTRLGAEVVGALAPLIVTGGGSAAADAGLVGKVAASTPPALLARGAEAAALGKSGSLTHAITKGAVEGAVYGAAGAADHAYLDGEPITAEAVFHGLGWGAVLGGVLSGIGHGISAAGSHEQAVIDSRAGAARKALDDDNQRLFKLQDAEDAKAAVKNAESGAAQKAENAKATARQAAEDARVAERNAAENARVDAHNKKELARFEAEKARYKPVEIGALEKTAGGEWTALRGELDGMKRAVAGANRLADDEVAGAFSKIRGSREFRDITSLGDTSVNAELKSAEAMYKRAMDAANAGRFDVARDAVTKFEGQMKSVGDLFSTPMPSAGGALRQLVELRAMEPVLKSFPRSLGEFATLSPQRAEKLLAALDVATKTEFSGAAAIQDATAGFSRALGVENQGLRAAWKSAKQIYGAEGKAVTPPRAPNLLKAPAERVGKTFEPRQVGKEYTPKNHLPGPEPMVATPNIQQTSGPGMARRALGFIGGAKAYGLARAAGGGHAGGLAAYRAVRGAIAGGGHDLAAVRAGSVGRVRTAAANYLPGLGKKVAGGTPSALGVTITGGMDTDTQNAQVLAGRRAEEVRRLATTINDSLFAAVEPLAVTQPSLAAAMHQAGLTAFNALRDMMPRDPGAISGLKSIWRPSEEQAAVMDRQLQVFHDPLGVAEDMLVSGVFDPIAADALRKMAPAVWEDLRVEVLRRITQPEVADRMTYDDQTGLSALLDLSIHSSMEPWCVAAAQQMHVDRNQPLAANPRVAPGGGPPSPTDSTNSTAAQRSTER